MNVLLVTAISLSLASCSFSDKDFRLNETEKEFLSSFRKGDTLYYENNFKDVDTFLVLGVDSAQQRETGYFMQSPAHNYVWVDIKQLPVDTLVHAIFYDSATRKSDTEFTSLFGIQKLPQGKKIQFTFSLRDFYEIREDSIGQLQTDPITINGTVIKNYYLIKNTHDSAGSNIEAMYWTKEAGLVAYRYHDGTTWTKKTSR